MSTHATWRYCFMGCGVALSLACGSLNFSAPALEDASYARASSAGYTLPEGADHIYTYDYSDLDRRSSYLRYTLPSEAFDRLIEVYRSSDDHIERSSWEIPSSWPDFGRDEPPVSWWQPTGTVVFQKGASWASDKDNSTLDSGTLVACDPTTNTVFVWMWQWERWTLPVRP